MQYLPPYNIVHVQLLILSVESIDDKHIIIVIQAPINAGTYFYNSDILQG